MVGNPPGAAPDEPAHYLKALAAGRGEVHLDRRPPAGPVPRTVEDRWQATTSRLVRIPKGLDPAVLTCHAYQPERSAGCLRDRPPPARVEAPTIIGTYQPYVYVVPGMLMGLADDPITATLLGRAGFWIVSTALLTLAAALLWVPGGDGYSLVGLTTAVTPMVLFMVSTLSANGLEIGAGICLLAAVVRLARDDRAGEGQRPWVMVAAGVSGTLLALGRPTGVLWTLLSAVLLVALVGRRSALAVVRRSGRWAVGAVAAVGVGVAVNVVWEVAVQPHPHRSLASAWATLPLELGELRGVYEQAIGVFGLLDVPMHPVAYALWSTLLLVVVVLALLVARSRQRRVLCGLIAGSVAVCVALAVVNRSTGFGMQARYVLAFVTAVPLVAGEILFANRTRLGELLPRRLPLLVAATAAAVHLAGWFANSRRAAVGIAGPRFFLSGAEWSPPLGWPFWLAVTLVAAACLVTAGVLAVRGTNAD